MCAGLSKVNHLLRVSGDILHTTLTDRHDVLQRPMLSRVLGGDLPVVSVRQAQDGVRHGGVALRSATEQALLAFIASRTETRPHVMHIFADASRPSTLLWMRPLPPLRLASTPPTWRPCGRLAPPRRQPLRPTLTLCWPSAGPLNMTSQPLLVETGVEDAEHPAYAAAQHLQHRLAAVVDDFRVSERLAAENCPEAWHDARRVADLCDETTSHEWMWELNPRSSRHLEQDSFVDAMRVCLGADRGLPAMQCHTRGKLPGCRLHEHALCCAPEPSTSGHHEVRDIVLATAVVADPAAEPEVLGLLQAAPGLRPAVILTSAAREGTLSALDVGNASSDARHAGLDAAESMRLRKLARYFRFVPELLEQGIEYQPLTWSCYGREHPATSAALDSACTTRCEEAG